MLRLFLPAFSADSKPAAETEESKKETFAVVTYFLRCAKNVNIITAKENSIQLSTGLHNIKAGKGLPEMC